MDIDVFSTKDLPMVFRALRTALRPEGLLQTRERLFLETYAHINGLGLTGPDPLPVMPQGVHIEDAHQCKRLVQLSAIAALLSSPVSPGSVAFVKELARRLRTHDPVLDILSALEKRQFLKVKLLARRRAFKALAKEAYQAEGLGGVLRFFGALFFGTTVNKAKLWNYKRLGLLPEGTLGREYWKHLTEVGFGFPGEPGGIADSVAYHDIAHVLAEHDTTPLGEIQQGSFQGGNRREDGFFFIQFVILHFHHGIQVTPVAPAETGNFDPQKVLWAIHRGAKCTVDMTHQWNFWPLMALTLEEARAKCGLLPKLMKIKTKLAA
ncbi:MAG TPA: hypothetical protein VKE95_08175 [Burkholderiales bacterium]|nr:hypothetical protein [Burkholderiales bacterium]